MILDSVDRFLERDVRPVARELESSDTYPQSIVDRMIELGLFGATIAPEYGGLGLSASTYATIIERICTVWMSVSGIINSHLIMAAAVQRFGTEEQKQKFIPGWVDGSQVGFFGMTEPESGADVASMKTVARDMGDHWEVQGNKIWVSNASQGDAGLLYVMTDPEKKHRGMSAFILEPKKVNDLAATDIETKLGLYCAPTGEMAFNGTRLPKDALLGEPGQGFKICMWQLNNTRLGCAAGALGVAGAALELAIDYANERTQFGKPISHHQMVQAQIAEMVVEHEAARMLVYRAAWLKDQGKPNQYETSMAKYLACLLYTSPSPRD